MDLVLEIIEAITSALLTKNDIAFWEAISVHQYTSYDFENVNYKTGPLNLFSVLQ